MLAILIRDFFPFEELNYRSDVCVIEIHFLLLHTFLTEQGAELWKNCQFQLNIYLLLHRRVWI